MYVKPYLGRLKENGRGKSGFEANTGAVNRGFTVPIIITVTQTSPSAVNSKS